VGGAGSVSGALWAWPASTGCPQVGQVPSGSTVEGERKRSHVEHQGTGVI
jgi:hypothetical protein